MSIRYLASNSIAPQFENVELGIGDKVLKNALAEATGRKVAAINADLKSAGDLGEVAEASKASMRTMWKPPPLTARQVFGKFKDISKTVGKESDKRKGNVVKALLAAGAWVGGCVLCVGGWVGECFA
jgi:DNA ligase-1